MLSSAKTGTRAVPPVATADAGKIRLGGGYRLPVKTA